MKYEINPYIRKAWNHQWTNSCFLERVIYDHEIIYIDKGCLKFTIENKVYIVEEGSCVILPPNVYHKIEWYKEDAWQPHVHFDFIETKKSDDIPISNKLKKKMSEGELKYFTDNFFKTNNVKIPYVIKLHNPVEVKKIMFKIIDEYTLKNPYYELTLKGLVIELISTILRDYETNSVKKIAQQAEISHLISYVTENIEHNFTLEELAEKANMSVWSLIQTFNKLYNTSPKKYFDRLRLLYAKNLLQYENKSIKHVAYQMEFESPQTFTRWFKKLDGKNPISYKK